MARGWNAGVTFWQFIDRQIGRLSPSGTAGAGIFLLTGIVLAMVYNDRDLANSDLFKTLAQAIVVQGLVGLAMAAWFTKKAGDEANIPTPREAIDGAEQVADAATRKAEQIAEKG